VKSFNARRKPTTKMQEETFFQGGTGGRGVVWFRTN
jgi:hypothetical protein